MRALRRLIIAAFFVFFVPQFLYGTDYIKVFYVLMCNSTLGECAFIQLPNGENVLIDGGNIRLTSNAKLYLDDFLDSLGVTTINHMILTHPDQDHSNGIKMAMDNYVVENFYCTGQDEIDEMNEDDSTRIADEGCNVYKISDFAGNAYDCYLSGPDKNYGPGWDTKVRVRVLCADDAVLPNPRSMVIKLSLGESSFYFGGDAEGDQEDSIMTNTPNEKPIDIFKAEHHGSDTNGSNKAAFLDWMSPKFAFIPTGGKTVTNGPPADAMLERLMTRKCIIYRTDLDGTILVKADDKGNYDIVRMNAFEYLETGGTYDLVKPQPKAFPAQSAADFELGNAASRTYVLEPPALPSGLSVLVRGRHEVTLDWTYDPSPSIEGYYVFYSTYSGGDPGANNTWKNAGMSEETGIYQRYNSTPITNHPYNLTGLVSDTSYYFRLSALTTYYYERRYSNEASTTTLPPCLPVSITGLSGLVLNDDGDINLSWTAPSISTETPTEACYRYRVIYASYSFSAFSSPFTYEIDYGAPEKFGIDFSTVQPKDPGQSEKFYIKNIPHGTKYFAVFGENYHDERGYISNISTLAVVDKSSPAYISNTSVSRSGSDGLYLTWTMPGDNGDKGTVSSCQIIYATNNYFSNSTATALSGSELNQGAQNKLISGLEEYTRYWVKISASDEAGNTSSSTIVSCYTGMDFINTPSFSDSVSVSTSPSLDVTFKIEIDTRTAGSPANCVELWDTRDNLGVTTLIKLTTSQYQVTAAADAHGFSVSPNSPEFDFNHKYAIVVSSSLKDIDGKVMLNTITYYFVTVCFPSENNVFIDNVSGSSVTVAAGQFSSPASVSFISTSPGDLNSAQKKAYDLIAATYTVTGSAVRGFTVSPGTVTAVIPVSGGIPYVYNSDTLSFEKALSYILNGEVVFNAQSPAVWLFVTPDSFTAKKAPGVYAYPVPCTGNSITFTNLGSSAEVGVYTISGKCVMREKVVADPVNGEWVWNFSRVSPGLYFWVVDGTSKGMLMIKR